MNYGIIRYVLARVIQIVGAMMVAPFAVSFIYGEKEGIYYLACAAGALLTGGALAVKKPEKKDFYAKEGFVVTAASWILLSVIGALPLYFSGEMASFTDALFETVSGFTTTGASVVPAVEDLSRSANFWRCFIQLIGGMGVLVFLLAMLPMTGGQDIYIMKAESPGPDVGKLVPRVRRTAYYLYAIYFLLTTVLFFALLIAGMPLYDAVCTAFTTTSTGGFGIKNDSLGGYAPEVQYVVAGFLFLAGINYNFYFYIFRKRIKDAFSSEEVRLYAFIFFASVFFIAIGLINGKVCGTEPAFRHAFFQVGSIMTTAGFSSIDYNDWPAAVREVIIFLMLLGGCAGSTSGGIKVSRLIIYVKILGRELMELCHPRAVKTIRMDGARVNNEVVKSAVSFIIAYAFIFVISVLLVSMDGKDFTTNFTAVASGLGNIGPGFSLVGPAENFAHFSMLSKYVIMFDMIAGRLEIFPLLVLLAPATWRRK